MPDYALDAEAIQDINELMGTREIRHAFRFLDKTLGFSDDELAGICEIPAPPFLEARRAEHIKQCFEDIGLPEVETDQAGNVLAKRPGSGDGNAVVIAAHLDTVFPEGTEIRVKREGSRLHAPGISDNACGVASLIGLARSLDAGAIETKGPVYLVATSGEEGEGNLRGVRHLFSDGRFKDGAEAFVSLDGPGLERITNRALGSRRYRVTITGPGGHSWGDFGIVNPVHALGRAIARFAAYPAPSTPRTSYNIGVIEGGNSVNAIPDRATMTVDIRSVDPDEIDKLDAYLMRVVDIAIREENAQRALAGTELSYSFEMIGSRPAGETPAGSAIMLSAIECSRVLGIEPRLDCSSTDSNIPISLGIPAITIGVGGQSGNCHTLAEWYDPAGREIGLKRLLLLTLSLAGLNPHS